MLSHRSVIRHLGRIVKDPWKEGPVEVDRRALIAELPGDRTISVRLDPHVTVAQTAPGKPHRASPDVLVLRSGKSEVGRVTGPPERLDALEVILDGRRTDDVEVVLLPADVAALEKEAEELAARVSGLLAKGRKLVEQVERLVCAMYKVPGDLVNEVVDHAAQRASRQAD